MNRTVVVKNLVKVYGENRAVDGVSFTVRKGEIFSLLGPNGAGKTTTVEMLVGLRRPTRGRITVLGAEIPGERERIMDRVGMLPQDFSSFDRLTVRETVKYFRELSGGGTDIDEMLQLVGLEREKNKLYSQLSGGLKRRLGIAIALVNDPEIVFLDEPTTGLDPRGRREIWSVIEGLKEKKKTVFLTTHYMEEAEALSDRVAIMSGGKIVATGSPGELIEQFGSGVNVYFKGSMELEAVARMLSFPFRWRGDSLEVKCRGLEEALNLIESLRRSGATFTSLQVRGSTLEEVFLNLTGEHLEVEES